jgi:hypothetical protein
MKAKWLERSVRRAASCIRASTCMNSGVAHFAHLRRHGRGPADDPLLAVASRRSVDVDGRPAGNNVPPAHPTMARIDASHDDRSRGRRPMTQHFSCGALPSAAPPGARLHPLPRRLPRRGEPGARRGRRRRRRPGQRGARAARGAQGRDRPRRRRGSSASRSALSTMRARSPRSAAVAPARASSSAPTAWC